MEQPKQDIMNIKRIPIEKIELNTGQIEGLPANPRQWTRDDIDRIAASLKRHPNCSRCAPASSIPHEGKYVLLAGNLRFCGARQNEMKDVPCCVVPRDTSIAKMKEIVLKDNGSGGARGTSMSWRTSGTTCRLLIGAFRRGKRKRKRKNRSLKMTLIYLTKSKRILFLGICLK